MRSLVILLIRAYQYAVSPLFGPVCRFHPSCSHYALEAVQRFGVLHGMCLAAWRLLRCNPWNAGGYDPVPPPRSCVHHAHDQ